MAHRPARRAAGSRRIAPQAAGADPGHARARQFSSGILQAGSPETKYQLSAHDPEFGAFLRSISHLTNDDHRMAFAAESSNSESFDSLASRSFGPAAFPSLSRAPRGSICERV